MRRDHRLLRVMAAAAALALALLLLFSVGAGGLEARGAQWPEK